MYETLHCLQSTVSRCLHHIGQSHASESQGQMAWREAADGAAFAESRDGAMDIPRMSAAGSTAQQPKPSSNGPKRAAQASGAAPPRATQSPPGMLAHSAPAAAAPAEPATLKDLDSIPGGKPGGNGQAGPAPSRKGEDKERSTQGGEAPRNGARMQAGRGPPSTEAAAPSSLAQPAPLASTSASAEDEAVSRQFEQVSFTMRTVVALTRSSKGWGRGMVRHAACSKISA